MSLDKKHLCQCLQTGQSQQILFLNNLRSANDNLKEVDYSVQITKSQPHDAQDQPKKKLRTYLKSFSRILGATLPVHDLSSEYCLGKGHPAPHLLHARGASLFSPAPHWLLRQPGQHCGDAQQQQLFLSSVCIAKCCFTAMAHTAVDIEGRTGRCTQMSLLLCPRSAPR